MKDLEKTIALKLAADASLREIYDTTLEFVSKKFTVDDNVISFTDFKLNIQGQILDVKYKSYSALIEPEISVRFSFFI